MDTSQPDGTRTPDEAHQNGFGLIVSRVTNSHTLGPTRGRCTTKKLVSQSPAGLFERRPMNARNGGYIGSFDDHWQGERRRQ
jgi:hypothetical protein